MSHQWATSPSVGPDVAYTAEAKKTSRGFHRIVTAAETMARVQGLLAPIGITRVANVTGLDCIGVPVVLACRPNARSLAVSPGKGVDRHAAYASALMESIELYHAERITQPLKRGSWNELRFSHDLAAIEMLPRVDSQMFHPDRTLLWIEGVDLFSSRRMWLPYELVHTDYTLPFPDGSGCFVMSSNGLASGNHLYEAVAHGLCEVIERDASTLFRCAFPKERATALVDLSTIDDWECRRVLGLYRRADVLVGVWDLTSDVGIPTFRCLVVDREPSGFRPMGALEGLGCHPAREIALLRALTEAAQSRLTLIAGSRDDTGRACYGRIQGREEVEAARAQLGVVGSRKFEDAPTHQYDTVDEDITCILGGLRRAGLTEAVVVDLTKAEFEVPVVRVVVPGLETDCRVQGYMPGERARRLLKAGVEQVGT